MTRLDEIKALLTNGFTREQDLDHALDLLLEQLRWAADEIEHQTQCAADEIKHHTQARRDWARTAEVWRQIAMLFLGLHRRLLEQWDRGRTIKPDSLLVGDVRRAVKQVEREL